MAAIGKVFDATQHDTTQNDFSNLPNGVYEVEVDSSDIGKTSNGRGTILKATLNVLRPEEFKNRKVFTNYNLDNENPTATKIGQQQFAALCRAIGISKVEDTEELHFKAFTVTLGLGKPSKDGKYPARTEIKRYWFPDEENAPEPAIDDNQPTLAPANDNRAPAANDNKPAPAATRPAAAAAGGKARPWAK